MKVCIVTVYDNINSGSYWQAYALGHVVKMLGHEVYYYKRKKIGASSSIAFQLKVIVRYLSNLHFLETIDYIKRIIAFQNTSFDYNIIKKSSKIFNNIECFILGSDTIWEISSNYYKNNKRIFWGDIFYPRKVISYAGSISNTPQETILTNQDFSNSVKNWAAISVRDAYTKKTLSSLTNKPIDIVCDPTLLLKEDFYRKICNPQTGEYVFLYLFKTPHAKQLAHIQSFANNNELKIICGTQRHIFPNADDFIINSPYQFIEYMLGAKYIITDTYHGTAFSINFNKQFVVINRSMNKVIDILSTFELTDRIVNDELNITTILNKDIDYSLINPTIDKYRKESLLFLKKNISNKTDT